MEAGREVWEVCEDVLGASQSRGTVLAYLVLLAFPKRIVRTPTMKHTAWPEWTLLHHRKKVKRPTIDASETFLGTSKTHPRLPLDAPTTPPDASTTHP